MSVAPAQTLIELVESSGLTPGLELEFVADGESTDAPLDRRRVLEACRLLAARQWPELAKGPTRRVLAEPDVLALVSAHRSQFPNRPVDAVSLLAVAEGVAVSKAEPGHRSDAMRWPALVLPDGFELTRNAKLLLLDATAVDRGFAASKDATVLAGAALTRSARQYELDRLRTFLLLAAEASGGGAIDAPALMSATRRSDGSRLPRFDGESVDGEDLLDIVRDVHGLASLVAARSVTPPLSVGLFGEWGSGKSFFMHKLRVRIEELAAATRKRDERGLASSYQGHIVQIEFNAWNYIEVDLWASLVTHIFEQLHRHFVPRPSDRQKWFDLLHELDDAEETYGETQQALRQAEDALAKAQEDYDKLRLSLVKNIDILWDAIAKSDKELDRAIRGELEALREGLGSEQARIVLRKVAEHRENFEQIRPHLPGYWKLAVSNFWYVLATVVVVLAIGALLAMVAMAALAQLPSDTVAWSTAFVARVAEAMVPVVVAVTWGRDTLARAAKLHARVEKIRAYAAEQLTQGKARRPEAMRVTEAEHALRDAEQHHAEQSELVRTLRAAEQEMRPSERLATFLEDRAASQDYRKYLGLPAMIRRDFEKLHRLLVELREQPIALAADDAFWQQLREGVLPSAVRELVDASGVVLRDVKITQTNHAPDVFVAKELDRPRTITLRNGTPGQAHGEIEWALPRIDRVVLYIDDLDRCPADRVVQVLQAVHLLLAFPLFVVVVGVDARWITKSLRREHPELFAGPPPAAEEAGPERAANDATRPRLDDAVPGKSAHPHDYLEKIFQIPYWLMPITKRGTSEMLGHFVGALPATTSDAAARPAVPEPEPATSPAKLPDAEEAVPSPDAAEVSSGGGPLPGLAGDDAEMLAPQLTLRDTEITTMHALAELIGRSPRAVKRYVNAYRLVRARLTFDELHGFVAETKPVPRFELTQLLLAIMIGAPDVAEVLFAEIRREAPEVRLDSIVVQRWQAKIDWHSERWPLVLRELTALAKRSTAVTPLLLGDVLAALEGVVRLSFRFGAR